VPGSSSALNPERSALLRRSFKKAFPSAVRGQGVYIWDAHDQAYLDFSGSAAVNFIGHGVAEIPAAMAEQARHLSFAHTSQFTTPVSESYAEELLDFAGEGFRGGAVYFTCGGSEAIESALKLARQYQVEIGEAKRYQVLSRTQSYHGSSLGALSVSGNLSRRELYLPMVRQFAHIGTPYCYRCAFDCSDGCRRCGERYAAELEVAIAAAEGEVAGFIFEPVSGATLGAVTPPPGYLERISEICRAEGVLLIADEVMTGMGRTGRNFAVEHWGIQPDMLVVAKGLSSGYAPLGAVLVTRKLVDAIACGSGWFRHGFTYNAHPVSAAAGRAVLHHLSEKGLLARADSGSPATVAAHLKSRLGELVSLDKVGDVRGIGMLWGVEFVADKASKQTFDAKRNFAGQVARSATKRGLLVYPMQGCAEGGRSGDHVLIAPPVVITAEQIDWAVEQLGAAILEASAET
jgi:adenosylmethionine-8-amino-7-oxononanoate aminotransferase